VRSGVSDQKRERSTQIKITNHKIDGNHNEDDGEDEQTEKMGEDRITGNVIFSE